VKGDRIVIPVVPTGSAIFAPSSDRPVIESWKNCRRLWWFYGFLFLFLRFLSRDLTHTCTQQKVDNGQPQLATPLLQVTYRHATTAFLSLLFPSTNPCSSSDERELLMLLSSSGHGSTVTGCTPSKQELGFNIEKSMLFFGWKRTVDAILPLVMVVLSQDAHHPSKNLDST
jgi:hypothetical protein